ncbi:hypothetical protein ACRRTK_014445 [Alexandromys fortis]
MAEAAGGSRLRGLSRPGPVARSGEALRELGRERRRVRRCNAKASRPAAPRGDEVRVWLPLEPWGVRTAEGQRVPARASLPTWLRENGTAQGAPSPESLSSALAPFREARLPSSRETPHLDRARNGAPECPHDISFLLTRSSHNMPSHSSSEMVASAFSARQTSKLLA